MKNRSERLLDLIDVYVLWSFAVAQPLYALLSANAGFFVARQSEPADIFALILALSLGLPLLLFLTEELIGLLTIRGRGLFHFLLLAALVGAALLPWAKKIRGTPGVFVQIAVALMVLLGAWAYVRFRTSRRSLVFLSPAVFLFPVLFVLSPPIKGQILRRGNSGADLQIQAKNPVPIIMVVFDEFPLVSLLNEKLEINPLRYPNFSALARDATWYRNATSVSDGTLNAVPGILTGRYPNPDLSLLPHAGDYPHSLFTMLGRQYEMDVHEDNTRLCPESLCGEPAQAVPLSRQLRRLSSDLAVIYLYHLLPTDWAKGLPDITHSWKDFHRQDSRPRSFNQKLAAFHELMEWEDRPDQFRKFVDAIRPSSAPALHFLHVLLPHAPWEYLPSGKRYTFDHEIRGVAGINDDGLDPNLWGKDSGAVVQAYQRHLLQVGLVDSLVGYLVEHLKRVGLYDPALLIVIADHGCSFRMGDSRRHPSQDNYADILAVPFFLKLPFQKESRVDDRNVEVIDLLPTLADLLQIDFHWKVDGQSAVSKSPLNRTAKSFVTEQGDRLSFQSTLTGLHASVNEKLKLFGQGEQTEEIYHVGPLPQLIGRRASEIDLSGEVEGGLELDFPGYFSSVDFDLPFLLTHVTGRVRRTRPTPFRPVPLVLAVNRTIQAVTKTFLDDKEERFSALVPPSAFREGYNEMTGFLVSGTSVNNVKLVRLGGGNPLPEYSWGDPIRFDTQGNSRPYQALGWGTADGDFTWALGKQSSLTMKVIPPRVPVALRAEVIGFLPHGKLERQRVQILVNGHMAGEWILKSEEVHEETLTIPSACFSEQGMNVLTFETPDAVSPVKLGSGGDVRQLSFGVFWMTLTPQAGNPGS